MTITEKLRQYTGLSSIGALDIDAIIEIIESGEAYAAARDADDGEEGGDDSEVATKYLKFRKALAKNRGAE